MKIRRKKVAGRVLLFFEKHFGFQEPYQVLLDGTFCLAALRARVNLLHQIPLFLGETRMVTTVCAVKEVEDLVKHDLYGAMCILKQFAVCKCGHEKAPISATDCFLSMLGRRNENHFIIATEDNGLRLKGRSVAGTPILYFNHNTPVLEKPSQRSVFVGNKIERQRLGLTADEKKVLKIMKRQYGITQPDQPARRRRKIPQGKNPLSCKKKKVKPAPVEPEASTSDSGPAKKKRKRVRVKIAKHVREIYRAEREAVGTANASTE